MSPSVPLTIIEGTLFERLESLGADASDLYRALANNPRVSEAWLSLAWGLRDSGVTARRPRELMILRSAQAHGAAYQWRDHVPVALDPGVTMDEIEAIENWRDFDIPTRTALSLAEKMIAGRVNGETLEEMERSIDASQRIELIVTAG